MGWGARLAASVYALAFPLWKMVAQYRRSLASLRPPGGAGPRPLALRHGRHGRRRAHRAGGGARPPLAGLRGGVGVLRDHAAAGVGPRPERASDRSGPLYLSGRRRLGAARRRWARLVRRARDGPLADSRAGAGRCWVYAVAAALLLVGAGAWQALIWHNSVTLWSRVVELEPDGAIARTRLGTALLADGRPLEAAAHYRRALEIFPRLPEANLGLALILAGEGRGAEALLHGRQAVARQPQRAGFRMVFAEILPGIYRREESLAELREGARLAPAVPLFPYLLALKLARMGRGPGGHRRARGGPPARARRVPLGSRGRSVHGAGVRVDRSPHRRGRLAALRDRVSRVPRPTALQLSQLAYGIAALDALAKSSAPPRALPPAPSGTSRWGNSPPPAAAPRALRYAAAAVTPPTQRNRRAGGEPRSASAPPSQPSSSTGRAPSAAAARRALAQAPRSRAAPGAARGRRRPRASAYRPRAA